MPFVQFKGVAAYGHSPHRTMIVGSTTTEMVSSCTAPFLLLGSKPNQPLENQRTH